MIFQMASGLVQGGWDAISNITTGIGKGASTLVSGFFPTPQRETIISETVQAAGGVGQTYRQTDPEGQSWIETMQFAADQWLASPYEQQFAIPAKIQESKQVAKTVSAPGGVDYIGQGLDWALEQTKKVTTFYDELSQLWSPRETVVGQPRQGYPEGRDERHLNDMISGAAEVLKIGKAKASEFLGQVKGLFGLGYDQPNAQPAFAIQHEVQPSRQTWVGLGIVAAIIVAVLLLRRKK